MKTNKTQTQKIKIKPAEHSHSHSLSFYTSFFYVLSKSITCSVFVSLFFFFLFRSMTLFLSQIPTPQCSAYGRRRSARATPWWRTSSRCSPSSPFSPSATTPCRLKRPPPLRASSRRRLSPPPPHPPPPRTTVVHRLTTSDRPTLTIHSSLSLTSCDQPTLTNRCLSLPDRQVSLFHLSISQLSGVDLGLWVVGL